MSRSSRNTRQLENWDPGPEYWVYVPNNNWNGSTSPPPGYPRAQRSLTLTGHTGDPWSFYEERLIRGPNFGLPRLPPPPAVEPVLVEAYELYSRPRGPRHPMRDSPTYNHERRYYQNPPRDESKLSPAEQKKAIYGLRKQLYSPHLSNIVKRIGTAKSTGSESARSPQPDDDWKRCAVCLEEFDTKQFLMLTPCDHMFHEECIVPWVKSQGKCPVCRAVIMDQNAARINSTYSSLPEGFRGI